MSELSVSASVERLLNDYTAEVKRQATNIFDQVAKEAVQKLRQTSPVGTGKNAGDYAKGWTIKRERDKHSGLVTIRVHNRTHYQLTHLLEYGHDMPQGGRSKANPHIEKVEVWSQNEVVRRLEGIK